MAEPFGEALRRRRAEARLSLRELARRASVDAGYLCRLEKGLRDPSADVATRLERALREAATSAASAGCLVCGSGSRTHALIHNLD